MLDELLNRLQQLPPKQLEQAVKGTLEAKKRLGLRWIPNPGPQTQAYNSQADIVLFGGEPGGGKLLNVNTPLPTPFGWTTMGAVAVGDELLDELGNPCRVTVKSAVQLEKSYRLTFSDGSQIEAGANHQWVTSTRVERDRELRCSDTRRAIRRAARPSKVSGKKSAAFTAAISARNAALAKSKGLPIDGIRTTSEVAETLRTGWDNRINHSVRVAKALHLPEVELLIDPYVLGAWLGDGNTGSGAITGIDEEIFDHVAAGGYSISRRVNPQSRGILGLQVKLRQLGVLGNKHIPAAYLRASAGQRLALLQGLMDTDGYCDPRGQCEFTQVKRILTDQVSELLHSLGIKHAISEGVATLYGRKIGPKYRIKFLTELPAFRLSRKLIAQKRGGFRGTHDVRYIVSAEEIQPPPMQCVSVDSPNRMYLCGLAMIPTHNTALIVGASFNSHQRALIMRRQYTDLDSVIDYALAVHGSRDGFNGSAPPRLTHTSGVIDFGAAAKAGDEQHWMGRPHDLLGIDEATQFTAKQIRFLRGWLRSTNPGQRVRTILATNPPLTADGAWVFEMFAPWINPQFHNPANPGELRWAVFGDDDKPVWVEGPGEYEVDGRKLNAESLTFIPSKLTDNPYYDAKDYQKRLDALPAEVREILLGGFRTSFRDQPMQVCPTAWVRAAQDRWTSKPPEGVPMCSMGVDASGGGTDPMIIALRHDGWYDKLIRIEGKDIPQDRPGKHCAGLVVSHRRDGATIIIDMGGGYGGPMYEQLAENFERSELIAYKGAEGTTRRTREKQLGFANTRSAALWQFHEALDPSQPGGSPIMLPPSPTLMADLTASTYEVTARGILVESKEDVCDRLQRSTDEGDAVVMAWYGGLKIAHVQGGKFPKRRGKNVTVNLGRFATRRH